MDVHPRPTRLVWCALVAAVGACPIAPLAGDSGLTGFATVVSAAYPVADVLLIAVIVRRWAAPGSRTPSYRWLAVNAFMLTSGSMADTWSSTPYLTSYVALVAAACVPSSAVAGADCALDEAKRLGRNRVEVFAPVRVGLST